MGLGLTSLLEIVDLSVDTVSTLGNESLVVIAAEEDIDGLTIGVGSLTVRIDSVDGVGVGDDNDDGLDDDISDRLDLLGGDHVGGSTAAGHVIDNNVVMMVIMSTVDGLVVMVMMVVMVLA